MISLALLFLFMAFYVFYNTSERAVTSITFGFENWISKNKKASKLLAIVLCILASILLLLSFGFGGAGF